MQASAIPDRDAVSSRDSAPLRQQASPQSPSEASGPLAPGRSADQSFTEKFFQGDTLAHGAARAAIERISSSYRLWNNRREAIISFSETPSLQKLKDFFLLLLKQNNDEESNNRINSPDYPKANEQSLVPTFFIEKNHVTVQGPQVQRIGEAMHNAETNLPAGFGILDAMIRPALHDDEEHGPPRPILL